MDNQPVPGSGPDPQSQPPIEPQPQTQSEPETQPQVPVQPLPQQGQPQFQPQAQPQPQFQPLQPSAPTPVAQAAPPASGGNKKKLIIIIASVVGVLVVAGIAIAVAFALFVPTKKDYEAASTQLDSIKSEAQALSSLGPDIEYSFLGSYDSFNEHESSAKASITKIREESKKLSELKAMRYGEGADKYKAFDAKLQAYLTYLSDYLTSLSNSRGAIKTCSASSADASSSTALKNFVDSCVSALKSVGDIPNEPTKQLLSKLQTEFEKYSSLISQLAAITDPYGKQYTQFLSIRDKIQTVDDNIVKIQDDYTASVDKQVEELSLKDAVSNLTTLLQEKTR